MEIEPNIYLDDLNAQLFIVRISGIVEAPFLYLIPIDFFRRNMPFRQRQP